MSVFDNIKTHALPWFACFVLGACSKHTETPQMQISGRITANAPMTLPQGAQLQLRLTDVSSVQGTAEDIATAITEVDALPHDYALPFDGARIDSTHRYMMDARIVIDGQPRYGIDTPHPVLTEGHDRHCDITLMTLGTATSAAATAGTEPETTFRGELRAGSDVTLYSAGMHDGHIIRIKEDHANGRQLLQADYTLNGAYLVHYRDSTGMDIAFDERGKPTNVLRNGHNIAIKDAMTSINAARNRVALLRSHALATMETRQHRDETEDPAKLAAMQSRLDKPQR